MIQKYIIELEQMEDNKWNITHELPTYNFSSPASISYNLINLTPHTTYKWRVAAATMNGTGPFTPDPNRFTTMEARECLVIDCIYYNIYGKLPNLTSVFYTQLTCIICLTFSYHQLYIIINNMENTVNNVLLS